MRLDPVVTSRYQDLKHVDAIVIPGVGNFKAAIQSLDHLRSEITKMVEGGIPLLGICLGMQLLFDTSEESPGKGLGFLKGNVMRLPRTVKTPHMGWNTIRIPRPNQLVEGITEKDYFYFVHSYYPSPAHSSLVIAETEYGLSFASIVANKDIYGAQFHPEKSGKAGEQILSNFASIVKQ